MPRFNDIQGLRFGRLQVDKRVENQGIQTVWLCHCDCGKEARVISQNLTSGRQISCGCYDNERKTTHGATRNGTVTGEYSTWKAMKNRCYRKSSEYYNDYGGRGIKVCESWLHSFENFLADMGERPSPKHSIERKNVNGDYTPENCHWATMTEQISNQRIRKDNTSGHKGVSWDKLNGKWFAYINRDKKTRLRLGLFENIEDAISARKQAELNYQNNQPSV